MKLLTFVKQNFFLFYKGFGQANKKGKNFD